jgi:hypothetical protein
MGSDGLGFRRGAPRLSEAIRGLAAIESEVIRGGPNPVADFNAEAAEGAKERREKAVFVRIGPVDSG